VSQSSDRLPKSPETLALAIDPATTTIDYIIVGSGAGGGPLAARLAEAGKTVLLLEAGRDGALSLADDSLAAGGSASENMSAPVRDVYAVPGLHAAATEDPELSKEYSVQHFTNVSDRQLDPKYDASLVKNGHGGIYYPRCNALGGCTTHHALVTIKPNDRDWEELAQLTGDRRWSPDQMNEYFSRIEHCDYLGKAVNYAEGRIGTIVRLWSKVLHFLTPRVYEEIGGHGTSGWLHTDIVSPHVLEKLSREDRQFIGILIGAAKRIVAHDKRQTAWRLKKALLKLNLFRRFDPNRTDQRREFPEGVVVVPTSTKDRRRWGVRERILQVATEFPDRLIIRVNSHVTRVLFDQKTGDAAPTAVGVEVKNGKNSKDSIKFFARQEIVLSGGTFGTPQLLMLSGIGPQEELNRVGITHLATANETSYMPCIYLDGVGKNLQDRCEVTVVSQTANAFASLKGMELDPNDKSDAQLKNWKLGKLGLYDSNGCAIGFLMKSNPADPVADIFAFGGPVSFNGYYKGWSKELLRHGKKNATRNDLWSWVILKAYSGNSAFAANRNYQQPTNGGTVTLASKNPDDQPIINFRSFNDDAQPTPHPDADAIVKAIGRIRDINLSVGRRFVSELAPGKAVQGDKQLLKWVKSRAWGHHASGTCRMGRDEWMADVSKIRDHGAVLDGQCRVHGVIGLRVVDASIFPQIPGYFLSVPIHMAAEKIADDILADSSEYPDELREAEDEAIAARRTLALRAGGGAPNNAKPSQAPAAGLPNPPSRPPNPRKIGPEMHVGLALSGGGVRSATFNLGVLQYLAKHKRLNRIDFMSTVSGGGFVGSFLGRMYTRGGNLEMGKVDATPRVIKLLSDLRSEPLWWLRTKANYLIAAGKLDFKGNLGIAWRNFMAVYTVMGTYYTFLFCFAALLGLFFSTLPVVGGAIAGLGHFGISPWGLLPLLVLTFVTGPLTISYWLIPQTVRREWWPHPTMRIWITALAIVTSGFWMGLPVAPLTFALVTLFIAWIWAETARLDFEDDGPHRDQLARNRLTQLLGKSLFVFAYSSVFAVIDSVAIHAAMSTDWQLTSLAALLAVPALALGRFVPRMPSVIKILGDLPIKVLATLGAAAISLCLLLAIDTLVHHVFIDHPHLRGWMTICAFFGAFAFGMPWRFLNQSALHSAYAARLARTYLGATNPARHRSSGTNAALDVEASADGDDIDFSEYRPHLFGGPLHLIGVCLNETIELGSRRELREHKGLPMCVSPIGVSVGVQYHAKWREGWVNTYSEKRHRLDPLPSGRTSEKFHVLATKLPTKSADVDNLKLSQWAAISGAAFGTGMGRSTSAGMSLLQGLVNLRLGFWWDTNIKRTERPGVYSDQGLMGLLRRLHLGLFRTQSILSNEWLGRFDGPSERLWYLTDGGHFENTGIYELIRRRVPLIISVDCGADPEYTYVSLGEVTRQVRMDFGCTIDWLEPSPLVKDQPLTWGDIARANNDVSVPADIQSWIHPEHIGKPGELSMKGTCYAMLGRIDYRDRPSAGWVLMIKPCLRGSEPIDIRAYRSSEASFPQQTTVDQFFDDTQWECYRKLGEYIAGEVICEGN